TDTAVGNLTLKERDTLKQYKLYPSISTKNIMADNKFLYSGIVVAFLAVIALLVFGLVKFFKGRNKSSW
ncbi:hypothetical protein NVV37_24415, partial [Escherichia coli]|nr:hypothetical protein [Escherichia coli]